MIYTCNSCRFTFKRIGEPEACPDCGKPALREATKDEKAEFLENHEMFSKDDN